MSEDIQKLVAEEVSKQLAARAVPSEDVLDTLRFLTAQPVVNATQSKTLALTDFNRIHMLTSPSDSTVSIELTLPDAALCVGKSISFVNIGIVGSQLTVRASGDDCIYGSMYFDPTFKSIALQNGMSITLITDGINWIATETGTCDAIVETGGYVNEIVSAWYRKLQSGIVLMGGTAALNGATQLQISLPTSLRSNDWPIVVITPLWTSPSGIPQVAYGNTSTTGFTVYSSKSAQVVWHAYGYWR